jgi:hypothetical protein
VASEPSAGILMLLRAWEGETLICVFDLAGRGASIPLADPGTIAFPVRGDERLDAEGRLQLGAHGGAVIRARAA